MVQDLVHNLCESLVENIDGVSGATSRKVVVATPVITLTGNSVTITCATTGATIYYTLDGSTPTSSSSQYSRAFTLDSSCTIKAIAIKGGKSSGIAEEEYVKPITYLTRWKLVGNSEVHGQEIWSCGEYSAVDGKYHILVQPLGGSIADIALDEPLRKVNDVADTIEFANGVAKLTRYFQEKLISASEVVTVNQTINCYGIVNFEGAKNCSLCMCVGYTMSNAALQDMPDMSVRITYMFQSTTALRAVWRNSSCENVSQFKELIDGCQFIYELATPTTGVIQVPQIEEADSYSCVISQGGKAVSWSSFETE